MSVKCVCGKNIDKVPDWLEGVSVNFVCTNCPERQSKPTLTPKVREEKPKENDLDMELEDEEDEIEVEDE